MKIVKIALITSLLAALAACGGGGGASGSNEQPPANTPDPTAEPTAQPTDEPGPGPTGEPTGDGGFAGYNFNLKGGADGSSHTVDNGADLQNLLDAAEDSSSPITIYVKVSIEDLEHAPIISIDAEIYKTDAPNTYKATLVALPLGTSTAASHNPTESGALLPPRTGTIRKRHHGTRARSE